jgi:hypothetical protein
MNQEHVENVDAMPSHLMEPEDLLLIKYSLSQIWRVETNEKLNKLIKHKNIINYIKAQRLSWFGHVQRMPDTRTVKKIFNWKLLIKRSQGRPKYRWEDNIKQDICQMKI